MNAQQQGERFIRIAFEAYVQFLRELGAHQPDLLSKSEEKLLSGKDLFILIRCFSCGDFRPNPTQDELNEYVAEFFTKQDDQNKYINWQGFHRIVCKVLPADCALLSVDLVADIAAEMNSQTMTDDELFKILLSRLAELYSNNNPNFMNPMDEKEDDEKKDYEDVDEEAKD